ncbi:hypothetical protein ACVI1L_000702 [Bradyrhizobium sp. USDA 4516]
MRRHSDSFPLVLAAGALAIAGLIKSVYEDAAKAYVLAKLTQWGVGSQAASLLSGLTEIAPAVTGGGIIVWSLYHYIRNDFDRADLVIVKQLETPDGDFGHYTAYLKVRNTSPTKKLNNCRCEIIELRHADGEIICNHVGLRTRNQANKSTQGRFNLDQGAEKYVPLFNIDQSCDDDGAFKVVSADDLEIHLEHGIYVAQVRAYGDSGVADEVTVRLNTSNCRFEIVRDLQSA